MLPRSRGPRDLCSHRCPGGRSRRPCGHELFERAGVELDAGRDEFGRGHPLVRRLPEHGRILDTVDHSVVVELRHVVHVHDGGLEPPVSALSSRWHIPTPRRGSLPPPPGASRAALLLAVLGALGLLAAGCGGGGAAKPATTSVSGRVAIGAGHPGTGRASGPRSTRPASFTCRRSRSTREDGSGPRRPPPPTTATTASS